MFIKFAKSLLLASCLFTGLAASAQFVAFNGVAEYGGRQATVSGLAASNYQLGIIPHATITVYLTGTTTLASIYSNASGTVLSNPFTADTLSSASPGAWLFYAATGQGYDVVMSGGDAPTVFPVPVTLTDLIVLSGGSASTSMVEVNGAVVTPLGGTTYNFVNGSSFAFTNPSTGQIVGTASGGGGGCQGTLAGDNTSTNCGYGNLVANTGTSMSTFGYANLTGTNASNNDTAVGTNNINKDIGAENVAIGDTNLVNATSLTTPGGMSFTNIAIGQGNSNNYYGTTSICLGYATCNNIGLATDGGLQAFDILGIGWGAADNIGQNVFAITALGKNAAAQGTGHTGQAEEIIALGDNAGYNPLSVATDNVDDVIAIGDGAGSGYANGAHDIVAVGDGADKQCIVSPCFPVPNPSAAIQVVAIGGAAGSFNAGSNIVAIGNGALGSNTTGAGAGYYNQGANNNAIGTYALVGNTTGTQNTALGGYAGADGYIYPSTFSNANHTGSNNTWIGYDSGPNTTTQLSNTIALGYQAHNTASNQTTIGNSTITSLKLFGCPTGEAVLNDGSGTCYTPGATTFPTGTANQMLYYAANGAVVTPLTLGTNLSITSGVLNATFAGLGQWVSLLPTATQTVAQPSGTSFSISGTSAITTFSGTGTTSQVTITSANTASSPYIGGYTLLSNEVNCFQPGYDLGNNGTSANGWSGCKLDWDAFQSATRGISQLHSAYFDHYAQGDTAYNYGYMASFGGNVAASDEAVTYQVDQVHQIGYYTGTIATGGTTGSDLVTTTSFACHGFCAALAGNQFADGGILLDTSKGGSTATLAAQGSALNAQYYTLASGTVPVSTAWGNIIPSSCTNNGNGQWQNYTATTCNVTLGTSPASPGNFVAGTDVCLAGPFQEESAVTAVGTPSGGVQSITFNTRYAWDSTYGNSNAALVMQGGACGQSLVATSTVSSWPIAYAVVGATSSTQVFFSNCRDGGCNGTGLTIPATPAAGQTHISYGASIVRASNVVTVTGWNSALLDFPVGSTVIVTGGTPSDFNGTFTVASNSEDQQNPVMTWAQTGANESSSTDIVMRAPNTSITFFPSAFITGTNNGVGGDVKLATNTVPFASGDTVVGAPTSQYQQAGLNMYIGQNSPTSFSNVSRGIYVEDGGPSQLSYAYGAANATSNGVAGEMFDISGSYGTIFRMQDRPANNGTILFVAGSEPVTSNAKPYNIFMDNLGGQGGLVFGADPLNHQFTMNQPLLVRGWGVCTAGNGLCGGGGGGGTVTSVSVGAWPGWLTPTVTTATTTPSIAVAASAIPNTALANSSTTVNGIVCTLGSTCTIPTGSANPPLTYDYIPAAVSDGGSAFAGRFTRYNSNQPQTGSVNPASSALGYMLFQATPTLPQYAEVTVNAPPYWTSSGMYLDFYSTATSGNAVMDVQTACVTANQVVGSPTFSTAITSTTAVSATANGKVRTALISGIAAPGVNGCPATGMTTPTTITIRVYADATSAVPVYLLGATLVTGRSQ